MLPTLLTARPGPQTLLLTALALLIAAATIMLACGPVAQPIPDAGDTLAAAPQAAGGGEEPAAEPEEPTATPTPTPELDCAQSVHIPGGEICGPTVPTKPPLKYPKLGHLNSVAVVAEAEAAAAGTTGQSGAEIPNVFVLINTENKSSTDALLIWLENNGVNRFSNWSEGDEGRISSFRADYIYAYVPPSLLVPLSRQEGIISIDDGCLTSYHC